MNSDQPTRQPQVRRAAPGPGAALAAVLATLLVAACAGTASPSPGTTPGATATDTATPTAAPSPSAEPSPPPTAAPTPTPRPTCPPIAYTGFVASDRLSNAAVAPGSNGDLVGFVLEPSAGSPVRPRLTVQPTEPPFVEGASGLPLEIAGEHHVWLKFEGMLHVDEAGAVVYLGPRDQPGIGGPVRQVTLVEAFEGYVQFVIGYDGPGCVAIAVQPSLVTIAIAAR